MPRPIVCLAPMDGVTDTAYRRLVRRFSPSVVLFSEFTSADGVLRSDKLKRRLAFAPEEQPYFVQLFGNNPETFREAAQMLEQQGVSGVDVNMGCPAKKIVHSQHGSGLMRDVNQACRIVEAIAGACALEVSVKTRLGWSNAEQLIPFTSALTSAGASLITIHGRTYNQQFSGKADWEPIYELKRHLTVPVLGNGDVQDHSDGLRRMGNLDGFMIGRSAIGNPWVFLPEDPVEDEGAGEGATDGVPRRRNPSLPERAAVMTEHYLLMREDKEERHALLEFRKHMVGYLRGFNLAKTARRALLERTSEPALLDALAALAEGHILTAEGHILTAEGREFQPEGLHAPERGASAFAQTG